MDMKREIAEDTSSRWQEEGGGGEESGREIRQGEKVLFIQATESC